MRVQSLGRGASFLEFADYREQCVEIGEWQGSGKPGLELGFRSVAGQTGGSQGLPTDRTGSATLADSHAPQSPADGSTAAKSYLLVSLQRGDEGPLVAKQLQALMSVIVAQLLEGGSPVLALVPRVLKARRVHHHDGGHGEVVGREGPGGKGERPQDHVGP